MHVSRRLLAVPVAAVLVWSLTACAGESAETPAASAPSSTSAEEAPVVEPAGYELTTDNFADMGAAMLAAESYDMAMTTGTGGITMNATGQARVTDAGAEMTMSMTSDQMPEPMEIRLVGGQMYVNLGEVTGGLFWQIDPTDTSNPMSASFAQSTSQATATESIDALIPALVSVTKSGPAETIDGVDAQPYAVVVDTSKIGGASAEQFAAAEAAGVDFPDRADLHLLGRVRRAPPQAVHGHDGDADGDDVHQLGRGRLHRGAAGRPDHGDADDVAPPRPRFQNDPAPSWPDRSVSGRLRTYSPSTQPCGSASCAALVGPHDPGAYGSGSGRSSPSSGSERLPRRLEPGGGGEQGAVADEHVLQQRRRTAAGTRRARRRTAPGWRSRCRARGTRPASSRSS